MVGLDMWKYQKHLDFTSLFPLASGLVLNIPILVAFLKRCGANVQSLEISRKAHHLNVPVLRTIGEFKFVCIGLLYKLKSLGYVIQTGVLLQNFRLVVTLTDKSALQNA
jgi:hypothetical protein